MTTRLRWHSKLSKRHRAAALQAVQAAGYPGATDDGEALAVPHETAEEAVRTIWFYLEGASLRPKLFSGIEAG